MFITDMKSSMIMETSWRTQNTNFANKFNFEYLYTNQTHFLYNTIPDEIAHIGEDFLNKHNL